VQIKALGDCAILCLHQANNKSKKEPQLMRYVIEFTKKTWFGFGGVDMKTFNQQLKTIQADGVTIVAITPHTFLGHALGYSVLVEDSKAI